MGVYQELSRALQRGLIQLCIKENKTVSLLDWYVLAVIRKEKYGLQSWFTSLVKISEEILLTMQWLNWTCCVTGPTLLPAWRLAVDSDVMLFSLSKITGNIFWNPLLFYTFVFNGERSICQMILEEEKPIEAVWHGFLPETDEH